MRRALLGVSVACMLGYGLARAQETAAPAAGNDLSGLAKQSQNPVANLNTILLQWNFSSGGGLGSQSMMDLNVQPVLPLQINENWIVVARTVIPFVNLRVLARTASRASRTSSSSSTSAPRAGKGSSGAPAPSSRSRPPTRRRRRPVSTPPVRLRSCSA